MADESIQQDVTPDAPAAPIQDAPQAVEAVSVKAEPASITESKDTTQKAATEDVKPESEIETKANVLQTTRGANQDYRKNKKFDAKAQKVPEDPIAAINKQVGFYFGDANLPTDEFLWKLTGGPDNNPVPVDVIAKFKRMQIYERGMVVDALRQSKFLDLEGEEGKETVKRKKAYSSDNNNYARKLAATVYAKGFGDEEPTTQFDLEAFFNSFGPVNSVRLRRESPSNLFKGSVYVEFPDEEAAKKFLEIDPKPKWKDHDLKIMSKKDYMAEKNELIKAGVIQPNETKKSGFFEGRTRGDKQQHRGRGGRGRGGSGGDFDRNDWKSRRDNDRRNGFQGRGRGGGRGGRGRGGHDKKADVSGQYAETRSNPNDVKVPTIQATDSNGKPVDSNNNGKREREGDAAEAPPAKKVDIKTNATTEA